MAAAALGDLYPDAIDLPEVGPLETGQDVSYYGDLLREEARPRRVRLDTDRGAIVIELLGREAPLTVASFVRLVERGYFDGMRFHRVVPNFVVQGGDPRGDGWGGPGYQIRCELNALPYERGTVGMALDGRDTGGSQFFIAHTGQPHLEAAYTVFGRVVEGMNVVDRMLQGDRIRTARLVETQG
jgi:cyclophilin family peptidyl-prolyl cis-trans isomerase